MNYFFKKIIIKPFIKNTIFNTFLQKQILLFYNIFLL
jgi:hypothetical protein